MERWRPIRVCLAATLAAQVVLVMAAPAAGKATITVSPSSVPAGGRVIVSGIAAGGCAAGDTVTLTSPAFSHQHEFAGVPAISATAESSGHFSVSTQIPGSRTPGAYSIGGRCGGGNLGVQASLTVTAGSGSGTLPRTGFSVLPLAALGLCLSAAGWALRRRA